MTLASDNVALNARNTLKGTRLFGRQLNLTIGAPLDPNLKVDVSFNEKNSQGRDISGLDVEFTVDKALKSTEPNSCSLKVYNLSKDTRNALSGMHALTVRLEAGYTGAVTQLYFAEVHSAWSTREGPDFITHMESRDTVARPTGVHKTKKLQANTKNGNLFISKGAKIPLADAFSEIAKALGIKTGNLQQALANINGKQLPTVNGAALMGNGAQRMTDLCRSAGLEWSIQDGVLQLLNIGQILSAGNQAIEISADTGMWDDSPAVDSQGVVSCSTALIPGLVPGVRVHIDSLFVKGDYRVEKCRYRGNTRGQEWTCHFDATLISL